MAVKVGVPWWYMFVVLPQENWCKFGARVIHMTSSRSTMTM